MLPKYSVDELMPTAEEIERLITSKVSYEASKLKGKDAHDSWCKKYFMRTPWGLAYSVSKAKYDKHVYSFKNKHPGKVIPEPRINTVLKYFIIAVAIDWEELVSQLKRTLKNWGYSSADLQQIAKDVWQEQSNLQVISNLIQTHSSKNLKLLEAIEKHNTLNTKLFTQEGILKDKVRNKMLEIVDEFLANLKEQEIKIKVDDIIFIGSNASYNYTKDSDIDLHILANAKAANYDKEIAEALYSAYRTIFNKNLDITLYDIPLEIFVETENSARVSNGVYSVKKNKWIKKPIQEDIPEYDKEALDELTNKWETKCKDLITDIKADKLNDEKKVVKMLEDIYEKLRKKGISKGEYSIENLAFKELRNKGYLDQLKDFRNELVSKRLSLEEQLNKNEMLGRLKQITKATEYHPPVMQDNGMFYVYNLKEHEINRVVQNLRRLPFITDIQAIDNGKYDFSQMAMTNLPTKYYNIRGIIIDNNI